MSKIILNNIDYLKHKFLKEEDIKNLNIGDEVIYTRPTQKGKPKKQIKAKVKNINPINNEVQLTQTLTKKTGEKYESSPFLKKAEQLTKIQSANVSRGTAPVAKSGNISDKINNIYSDISGLFNFVLKNRSQVTPADASFVSSTSSLLNTPQSEYPYKYEGKPVKVVDIPDIHLEPGNIGVQFKNGNTVQVAKSKVTGLTSEIYDVLSEGKILKDKDLIRVLSKKINPLEIKNFENLIYRILLIRNQIAKLPETGDKRIDAKLGEIKTNPIFVMDSQTKKLFDFEAVLNIITTNPQEIDNYVKFIKTINERIFNGNLKTDIVSRWQQLKKMGLEEQTKFYSHTPKQLANDLFLFIEALIGLIQILAIWKREQAKKIKNTQQAKPIANTSTTSENVNKEKLEEEITRIKKIMLG
jgi:hypothetical protein